MCNRVIGCKSKQEVQGALLTQHGELDVLGGRAQAVGGGQRVDGAVVPSGLLDQQCALVLAHQFVDVLVVLDRRLLLGLGQAGLLPGERGEGAATHLGHHADVTSLLALDGLAELDGGSTWRDGTGRGERLN